MHNCLFSSQHLNMDADVPGPGLRLGVLMFVILFIGGTKYFTRILTLRRGNKQFTDISGRILSSPHSDLLAGLELPTKIRDSEKVLCYMLGRVSYLQSLTDSLVSKDTFIFHQGTLRIL